MPNFIDLTGDKYGRLTVVSRAANRNKKTYWLCECDCGNKTEVDSGHLRNGHTKSCGCLQKEAARNINFKDISGKRFGKLVALKEIQPKDGQAVWQCQCDCGSIIEVKGIYLRNGHTKSCGCLSSIGEEKIAAILKKNNISYRKEMTFSSCRFLDTDAMAKFDFAIINQDKDILYLIEYDGIQHFTYNNYGWNNETEFRIRQNRDIFKNEWCLKNNIPLIRIPYTHLNNLCLEDLLLETTKYRAV